MSERRIDAFFYGLFMDSEVLGKSGVEVVNPRRGYVQDFALFIGNRATLIAMPQQRSYGMVLSSVVLRSQLHYLNLLLPGKECLYEKADLYPYCIGEFPKQCVCIMV